VRGIAVGAVLLFHGGFAWMGGGFLGVSTFFTLSGFLIAMLLLTEWRETGRIDLSAFWARRFRRLMPALYLTLLGVALFGATVATPDQLHRLRADGLATLGYVANWRFLFSGQRYGELFASPSPLLHAWSLGIEEQFYVLFPLVMAAILTGSRTLRRLAILGAVLAGLAVASSALMVVLHTPGGDRAAVYYGTHTRIAEILAGTVLAVVYAWRGPARTRTGQRVVAAAGTVGLGLSVAAWVVAKESSSWLYEGGFAAYALATVAVVAAAVHPGPVRTLLSARPLQWLGRVSYGAYLFHWPLFLWLSPERTGLERVPLFALRLVATLVLAGASYRFFEHPIRTGRRLTGWRPKVAIPAGASAVAASLVLVTVNPPAPGLLVAGGGTGPARSASGPAGAPVVFVAGDSVALTIAGGIDAAAGELGVRVVNRGALGCGVAPGSGEVRLGDGRVVREADWCRLGPARWAPDVAATRPATALLVLGAWDAADRRFADRWVNPCSPGFGAAYERRVTEAVRTLGSTGADVAIALVPYLRSPVITADQREGDRRIDCMNAVFRRVAARVPGVTLVDLARLVCPAGRTCRERLGGVTLRPDGVHYDGPGGAVVARWLVPRLPIPEGPLTTREEGRPRSVRAPAS
jgi:peptidoglycan/LPS O-acetylase OafA/YrhL